MARLRIQARAEYRQDGNPVTRNAPITAIAAGDSTSDWPTEKARSVGDLKALFKSANQKKKITFKMEPNYARMTFPDKREIDFLSIAFTEWSQTSGSLLSATCKDLTVVKNAPASGKQSDSEKAQIVTLQLHGESGFTT